MISIVMGILVTCLFFCFFMLYRNQWVYKQRMNVLNNPEKSMRECLEDDNNLISYDEMMSLKNCFVFDIEKLKRRNK